MNVKLALRRIVIWLTCTAFLVAAIGPWCLYWGGLAGIEGRPFPSAHLATTESQTEAWHAARGVGTPILAAHNPYSYIAAIFQNGPTEPSQLIAWHVASGYLLKHQRYKGMLWWHYSGAALTLWVTRNWTIEQLLTEEANARTKGKD